MAGVAQIIDDMLAAEKSLGGVPQWQPSGMRGEYRLVIPLLIDGVSCGSHLEVDSYPNIYDLRFRLMIFSPTCVWRVDYTTNEPHVNPLDIPADIPQGPFDAPHYHAWADNRRFCTQNALPDRLPVARMMPPIRQFDAAFRWFCGQTNIAQPPAGLVELPPRTQLL